MFVFAPAQTNEIKKLSTDEYFDPPHVRFRNILLSFLLRG